MARDRHGVKFAPSTARRILDVGRQVEQQRRSRFQDSMTNPDIIPGCLAIATSTIGAGNQSAKTLGSGTAKLQYIYSTTSGGVTTYHYDAIPDLADVTVLNGGTSTASGSLIEGKLVSGYFLMDVDFC